ncbi:beta-N-acetylhexosaminidase [Echinicola sp. 20G]|uniref:beta-N-acetylhexosaminidase n=1 Tax=Echinicola sp. 20G TaxID=2781961 RepID=UPI00190FF269|nr:beta-N-acetylhexosaminidase [Echinicola sp. 20G]
MKFQLLTFLLYLTTQLLFAQATAPIIPAPTSSSPGDGFFHLTESTSILYSSTLLKEEAHYLQKELLRKHQLPLALIASKTPKNKSILLELDTEIDESYQLLISDSEIKISSSKEEGLFYGIISLIQLVDQSKLSTKGMAIPAWEIKDAPKYQWRGFMLDESRHFFGTEKVKSLLDWMAYYKLNKFHWHLTDAQGWRIEILKYPKLALVGGIGNNTNPYAPAQYYTQEQIKEIVRYANERNIEVIPEIDMPGHATAANKAYPEFSGGGSEKHPEFTFNPGKEETYQYLTDILKEVNVLFPGQMVHLGGDEVSFGNQQWSSLPEVKQLMRTNDLSNLKEVEDYFMKRMADSLFTLNNKILAWDEMAEAGLPTENSILLWWRHDKPQQFAKLLENNIPTVICPRIPFYFDFVQQESDQYGRKWGGNFNPLERVYSFEAKTFNIPSGKEKLILGLQANLWTETVTNTDRLDYLVFPRIAALAEAAWTNAEQKDFKDFEVRIKKHFNLYEEANLYFFDPFEPHRHPEPIIK